MELVLRRLEQAAMAVAVLCIVAIMLVVSFDALSRYALHAPLPWAFEAVTYYLMVATVYGALAGTFTHGDHVSITLFQEMIPERPRVRIEAICCLMAAAVFAMITYGAWHNAVEAYVRREFLPGYIVWPAWLSQVPVPVGCALIVLRLVHHSWVLLRNGNDPNVATFQETVE